MLHNQIYVQNVADCRVYMQWSCGVVYGSCQIQDRGRPINTTAVSQMQEGKGVHQSGGESIWQGRPYDSGLPLLAITWPADVIYWYMIGLGESSVE